MKVNLKVLSSLALVAGAVCEIVNGVLESRENKEEIHRYVDEKLGNQKKTEVIEGDYTVHEETENKTEEDGNEEA